MNPTTNPNKLCKERSKNSKSKRNPYAAKPSRLVLPCSSESRCKNEEKNTKKSKENPQERAVHQPILLDGINKRGNSQSERNQTEKKIGDHKE
jgi:hypothetical protein